MISRADAAARIERRRARERREQAAWRRLEFVLLAAAAIAVAAGLALVYQAKIRLATEPPLNLNTRPNFQTLLPYLQFLSDAEDREFAARRIAAATRHGNRLRNVGTLGDLRVTERDLALNRGLESFPRRLKQAREIREARERERRARMTAAARVWEKLRGAPPERPLSIPLLTGAQLAQLKPQLAVRSAGEYRNAFLLWTALFFAAFFVLHLFWRARGFASDNTVLPAILLLSGAGLILITGLRDPLRDTLAFANFSQGVVAGCAAMALFSLPDYERRFGRLSYVPLAAALLLALALGLFGTGPGTSDAKVNLFFFQPAELIRILLVMFLAGYFAQNWDALRELRHAHPWLNLPRLDYALPVMLGVAAALLLFFWLNDLGPALLVGGLFLALYSIARNGAGLAAAGLAVIVLGFWAGHAIGKPEAASERVTMWLSPWDNGVRGGDQVADGLWAMATGGVTGSGPGLGSPNTVPAAHTDLILAAAAEEFGWIGLASIAALYAFLLWRGLRIALRAPGAYSFFLAAGLTLMTALEIVLIAGGVLGLLPLTGVVSPFLSYGRTAMVANFALFGMILAVSAKGAQGGQEIHFGAAVTWFARGLAAAAVVLVARAAWVQVIDKDEIAIRPALVRQADGVRRYQYNPRLMEAARMVPKGDIYDREGVLLASSSWEKIDAQRARYQALGVPLERNVSKTDRRHYPMGAPFFYLVGDVRSPLLRGAPNTAFVERGSRIRLQGFDDEPELEIEEDPETGEMVRRVRYDYRELIPLMRHRHEPDHPQVQELLSRPRDVKMTVHAGLQLRAASILRAHLQRLGKEKGALVALDPATGDLLAAVSYPWPAPQQLRALSPEGDLEAAGRDLIDRARYGLYPPGSAFKIVTAIAALRKDPALARERFDCTRLPDGRVGQFVKGYRRPVRDDIKDAQPHGAVDMARGVAVSCNAYFAQLGTYRVGAPLLLETAGQFGIVAARPNTARQLRNYLPQSAFGQGQVVASPFQMARLAAAVANGGFVMQGRWILDETNPRTREPLPVLPREEAARLAGYMRSVVTGGTGRSAAKSALPIAGKTGTAELEKKPSHAWFIGFAPYGENVEKQIAFAVLVEHGQYGGTAAAPIAAELVAAARELGLL